MSFSLAELAQKIGADVQGDASITVQRLATLAHAGEGDIAFLANTKYKSQLVSTQASAVIISADVAQDCPTNALIMKDPYLGFAQVAQLLDDTPAPATNIAESAVIDASATLGSNVAIGANAVIEAGVVLGDNVVIGANCFVGKQAKIGDGTKLWANVSIYHKVVMGKNCLVQANTVIGSDGFGYANHQGNWVKIPQLGSVVIGDNVEIGAGTTIDRGALDDTQIHDGVIIDNQVQIAHNVVIGQNTAVAGSTGIAGSTVVGKNCIFGGNVGVNGHIEIADGSVFTGMAMVTKSTTAPGVYSSGMPAAPSREWSKMNARIRKLPDIMAKLKELEKQLKD
ncbi:UDP-3-O-(3-hydroxymyristoyl)glucosamine N-acyltransferase [Thalassotalea agarivorans]|uniref:UDP-3-O-acylglucosamine N-acyltransferase n=1 Tax=Thalassotalea agarivorans TaxID=349064 RepID=A0A1H9ZT16_THASX|nr:UDP-3-O-(3-hydroxymyristoyl)glucosamine N-acyltransferase [Thalassotalea agarivorans]SES84874.1 UDP-3-O-[3-hydroxymyristoyl] glucosamine N-acyltransferase [Thalassotalea agarivorans]